MPQELAMLEAEATSIRDRLQKQYGLSKRQTAALPDLELAAEVATPCMAVASYILMEAIMTPEDREWMERSHEGESFEELLSQLTPPREVHLTEEQKKIQAALEVLTAVSINYMLIKGRALGHEADDDKLNGAAIEMRKLQLMEGYEKLCVALIESRNMPQEKLEPLAALLSRFIRVPADQPQQPKKKARGPKPGEPGGPK